MMLRDSGSNMVKACNDWNIHHFPCIGHSLHLVVGPFLVIPKRKGNSGTEHQGQDSGESVEPLEEDDDALSDSFDSMYADQNVILEVREVVQDMRKFCSFVKNSTKCIEKLDALQKGLNGEDSAKTLKVKMDVRTRWNSTLAMINRMLQLMQPINDFIAFFKSPVGKKEFGGNRTVLPDITAKKWAILHGLSYLLTGFERATRILSGEKYPTFVCALPVLRKVKQCLSKTDMFNFNGPDDEYTRRQRCFLELYGNEYFFDDVTEKLEACRRLLYTEFCDRFKNLDASILWCTLLDPRYNLSESHWDHEAEKETATKLLVKEVQHLATEHQQRQQVQTSDQEDKLHESPTKSLLSVSDSDDEFSFQIYSEIPSAAGTVDYSSEQRNLEAAKLKIIVAQEVQSYLMETDGRKSVQFDPLEWWRINCNRYPNVARAARKWLSVSSTSTPSERVFSICAVVDTAKRSCMLGESIENQVFMHNNYLQCSNLK